MEFKLKWHLMSDPPKESNYVLLAITHHNIPEVVMGHCKLRPGSWPLFTEPFYSGVGVQMHYWAEMPKHPFESSPERRANEPRQE
jgi:hypothetical protein